MKRLLFIYLLVFVAVSGYSSDRDTLRVLAIGNSFSIDGAEYLCDIAGSAGVPIIVGNMYIGGCSLERHYKNSVSGAADYSYQKNICGERSIRRKLTLEDGVTDDKWDVITLQQASQFSGMYETYNPYTADLMTYVRKVCRNENVKFALHRTWAYTAATKHGGFVNYNRDQATMFAKIVEATGRVAAENGIEIIIPSGVAIQNARATSLGENLNIADGYHLNPLGRYTAGCVWFEVLCGKSAVGNKFRPDEVSSKQAKIAQQAAHAAVAAVTAAR